MVDISKKEEAVLNVLGAPSLDDESFSWFSDLSDLDRLNIINSPLEDRARVLASKYSYSLDTAVRKIA